MTQVPPYVSGRQTIRDGPDYPVLDIDSVASESFAQDLSDDSVSNMAKLAMEKVEVELVGAFVDDAVAVDVTWYRLNSNQNKLFEAKRWYNEPPDEAESHPDSWRDVERVERYDLTQTTDEEFEAAMERSEIDFSRLKPLLTDE